MTSRRLCTSTTFLFYLYYSALDECQERYLPYRRISSNAVSLLFYPFQFSATYHSEPGELASCCSHSTPLVLFSSVELQCSISKVSSILTTHQPCLCPAQRSPAITPTSTTMPFQHLPCSSINECFTLSILVCYNSNGDGVQEFHFLHAAGSDELICAIRDMCWRG
jgi:hypothetical protein